MRARGSRMMWARSDWGTIESLELRLPRMHDILLFDYHRVICAVLRIQGWIHDMNYRLGVQREDDYRTASDQRQVIPTPKFHPDNHCDS